MINSILIRTLKIIGHYDRMMEVYIIRKDNWTYNGRPVGMSRAEQSNNVIFIIKSFISNRLSVSSDGYFALPGNGVA